MIYKFFVALTMAMKLNEANIIHEVIESVPPKNSKNLMFANELSFVVLYFNFSRAIGS